MGVTASILFMAVGTGTQVYGQYKQGKAAQAAGEAEARAAESAAQLLETRSGVSRQRASDAITLGAEEESDFRSQVRGFFGTQRVGFAGQNVDLTTGSPRAVTDETLRMGELDALRLRTNAKRTSEAYLSEAADYEQQARNAREGGAYALEAGNAASTAANIGAVGSIIGGAGDLLATRYGFSKTTRRPGRRTSTRAGNVYGSGLMMEGMR